MSAAVAVTFVARGPSTNHVEKTLCIIEMPTVPEKGEEVEIANKKYGVLGRYWKIMPESDMQHVKVLIQDR